MLSNSPFSAAPSALGYAYQVEVALVTFLERAEDESHLSLEVLDDIAMQTPGSQPELFQAKARITAKGSLSDGSGELWKTLRVWSAAVDTFPDAVLTLVTQSTAPEGSIATLLRPDDERRASDAHDALVAYAQAKTTASLSTERAAFLGLDDAARRALVDRIIVVDEALGFDDIDSRLGKAIRWVARGSKRALVVQRLREWWLLRAEALLLESAGGRVASVTFREVQERIEDINAQLAADNLPVDYSQMTAPTAEEVAESQQAFVMQLRLIALSDARIRNAIHDHNRAFAQRARWAREDLLRVGELAAYDDRLKEEWERIWSPETDDDPDLTDEDAERRGRDVHRALEQAPIDPIRKNVSAPYVRRGSMQLLAEDLEIGWHPDWVARMQAILTGGDA